MSPSSNMNSRQQRPNYSRLKGKCVPTCTVDPSVVPFAHRTSWLAHGDGHPHKTRLSANGNMQKLPRDPSMPWRQPPLTPGFHRPPQVNVSPVNWCQRIYDFHISSDQPAHQARLLRTTLNSLVERAKPPDRPIMKTRRTNSSIPRPRARAQELSVSPFPLRVQEAGGNDHHPTSRELPTEYFRMP